MNAAPRDPGASALLTDLYQLTMLQSYYEHGMNEPAAFEFFVRKLPPARNFLLAAGLKQALEYLENLRFGEEELEWLRRQDGFSREFVDRLAALRFTGDADAMPEGTPFFPDEPILRVVAPLPQAQLVETRLVALLHLQTLIASKAARCVLAAPGKLLVDFGLRRAHGAEAGLLAARAAYLAGFAGTATVLAGLRFGIPLYGTMAHSFVQAFASETAAFLAFARGHPRNTVLLIDTYDTEEGAHKVVELIPRLRAEGIAVKAVRLDSGDLGEHARRVRRILDDGGCSEVRIFASGGLDEHVLARLAAVPIDGFGVGTSLVTSSDAAGLDCAYKLQEYAGVPRRKRSDGKATWPGRKQCVPHDGRRRAHRARRARPRGRAASGRAAAPPGAARRKAPRSGACARGDPRPRAGPTRAPGARPQAPETGGAALPPRGERRGCSSWRARWMRASDRAPERYRARDGRARAAAFWRGENADRD